jgi:sulfofructose kinase
MPALVLGAGAVTVDDLLYVDQYPAPDSKTRVAAAARRMGGLSAAALVAAARMGAPCAFAGVLGSDELSQLVLSTLAAEGIDSRGVVRRDGARPRHSTIIVDLSRGTRTVLVDTGGVDEDPTVPTEMQVREAGVLLIDHTHSDRMLRLARAARASGVPMVADFERDNVTGFAELVALADHLVLPWSMAARLTGAQEPARAVEVLSHGAPGRAAVVVTRGEQGAWYRALGDAGPVRHQPAFRVAAVDTTGCGDVFHGAYAAALAEGLAADVRVRLASAAAALKATRRGGATAAPSRAEVELFLSGVG